MSIEGRATAKMVLEAHRDDIQHQINNLWSIMYDDLREIEKKKLNYMLEQVNKALKWVKENEG
tara:strand:+ start:1945 stop:2133 length:189 start_codon:yes stop_codon:yes gene_type:complete